MRKLLERIYSRVFIRFSKFFSRKNLKENLVSSINLNYKEGMFVLNIGSGGEIDKILRENNVKFKSIDIDEKRNPDYVMSIEDMNLIKSNSVDMIFMMEVLEHVQNPHLAVKEIKRVLKKDGGVLVGSTPFLFPIHDEPYDFYRYTKYGLEYLFKDFEKVKLIEKNSYFESVIVVILRLFNVGTIRERLTSVLLFPFTLLLVIYFSIFRFIVTNKQATTGYFFIFRNKNGEKK